MHIELVFLLRRQLDFAQRFLDQVAGRALQIATQTQPEHGINEPLGRIPITESSFGDRVVPRKGVMVVVEAFSHARDGDPPVLSRLDLVVVRTLAENVSRRVDEPDGV